MASKSKMAAMKKEYAAPPKKVRKGSKKGAR